MSDIDVLLAVIAAGGFVIGLTLFRDEDAIAATLLALMCGCLMAAVAAVILWLVGVQ